MRSSSITSMEKGLEVIENVGMKTLKRKFDGHPNSNITTAQYIGLYTTVHNMVYQHRNKDQHHGLYVKYREYLEDYITTTVIPSVREKSGELILCEVAQRWENHKIMVKFLSRFFYTLEVAYVRFNRLPSLVDVGLSCFSDMVSQHCHVWNIVSSLIDEERKGKRVDRALSNKYWASFDEIGMGIEKNYPEFEAHCLKSASDFYSTKASAWMLECSSLDYLLKADECLKKEEDIVSHYLKSTSLPKVMQRVRHELLSVYSTQLIENEQSGFLALLRNDKAEDLSRIYRLLIKIPHATGRIAAIYKQHVVAEDMALFKQAEDAVGNRKLTIMDLIDNHYKRIQYVKERFTCTDPVHYALNEAFEVLCNKFEPKSSTSEILVRLCDDILSKGGIGISSDEPVEDGLDKILTCVVDTDLFSELYRRKLARRCLSDKSANQDHEKLALMKLKHYFGVQFTSKMEGMFNDLALANENQTEWDNYINSNPNSNPGIKFKPNVLSSAFWPPYKSVSLNLPQEMAQCIGGYQDLYQMKTKKRKLTWNYWLDTCHINGRFESKTIELIVTASQAAALFLFNTSDRLSYSAVKTYLNLSDDDDVVRLLHSLSCGKYKILNKKPSTDTISSTDYFEFNSKFTDKMTNIKIPLPTINTMKNKRVIEDVIKERRHTLEAAIVRIMKRDKALNHKMLLSECARQISQLFKPDMKEMKMQIESLISREFLERDQQDHNLLKYLP